jgi:hypothetical protein
MRIGADLWHRLDQAARASGRSLSSEAESRLQRSFQEQDLLDQVLTLAYGRQTAGLVEAFGETIRGTVIPASSPASPLQSDWLSDPRVFAAIEVAVTSVFDRLRPAGDAGPPLTLPSPAGPYPIGLAVANGVLQAIAFGSADSGDDLARRGAHVREKLGPAATERLQAALLEGQAPQPEPNQ